MFDPIKDLLDLRPAAIVRGYWMEQLAIEEDADFLPVVYIEVVA